MKFGKPALVRNRSELIRMAIRRLSPNTTTKRIQEYVNKHFGITVSAPLVCNTRTAYTSEPAEWKAKRQMMLMKMLLRDIGYDDMLEILEGMQEEL